MDGPNSDFQRGDPVGRYLVLDTLGRGGMGVVLRAFDPDLDRTVAIKVLPPDFRDNVGLRSRLLREGQAMARLVHPHVVAVHDVGTTDTGVFIAMELVDGENLQQWLQRPRQLREVIRVFIDCARGLSAAHRAGLIHGDFKPANVLVTAAGTAKVADFGLARPVDSPSVASVTRRDRLAVQAALHPAGSTAGTQGYVAPECALGTRGDARSDQYSFCVALQEATLGQPPHLARSDADVAPVPPRALPARLRRLLRRGLAPNPADRFEHMDAVVEELQRLHGSRTRLLGRLGVATLVIVTAGSLLSRGTTDDAGPCAGADSYERVWDDARKQKISAAMLTHPQAQAASSWTRLEPAFDRYANKLARAQKQACEATFVHHEQSDRLYEARALCYAQCWEQLDAVLDVLQDPETTPDLDDPAAALLNLDVCGARAELLLQLPTPTDSETERHVDALQARLARVQALRWAGRIKLAHTDAAQIARDAEAVGFAPTHAEAEFQAGLVALDMGNYDAAEKHLASAYWIAAGNRHDRVAAQAATAMVLVVGLHQENLARGEEWVNHAHAAVQRFGLGSEAEVDLASAHAALLLSKGDAAEALRNYQRVLELMERTTPGPTVGRAMALQNSAVALEKLGRFSEARAQYDLALQDLEVHFGPEHPRVGQLLHNLAVFHHYTGAYTEALEFANRALEIKRSVYPATHPSIARSLQAKGVALLELHRADEARAAFEQAMGIVEASLGQDHPEMGAALINLGFAAQDLGDFETADASYQRAERIVTDHFDRSHPLTASVFLHRGRLFAARGRLDEAVELLEQARQILVEIGQPQPESGEASVELTAVLTRLGRLDEAGAALQSGLGELERSLPVGHPLLARAQVAQSILERARADRDE